MVETGNTNRLTLDQLADLHDTDKATRSTHRSRHGYAPIYDELLSRWRDEPIRMLEIGICMEGTPGAQSVRMWKDYFTKAELCTFDIVDMHWMKEAPEFNGRVSFYQGDQGDRESLTDMYEYYTSKPFDVILEDGSHQHNHQMISFGHLFKYVKSGGYYILEDMSIPDHPVCCIRNDETFKAIEGLASTGIINSEFLLPEEKSYIESNIKNIEIYGDIQDAYAVAIITKK